MIVASLSYKCTQAEKQEEARRAADKLMARMPQADDDDPFDRSPTPVAKADAEKSRRQLALEEEWEEADEVVVGVGGLSEVVEVTSQAGHSDGEMEHGTREAGDEMRAPMPSAERADDDDEDFELA